MTNETTPENNVAEEAVVETTKNEENFMEKNSDTFSRIFFTILFGIIGWLAVWIFAFVIIVQFGFLLITGKVNKNLKAFNKEIGLYLTDIIKYLSFQTDNKPFPFRDWPYDAEEKTQSKEQNATTTVEASK